MPIDLVGSPQKPYESPGKVASILISDYLKYDAQANTDATLQLNKADYQITAGHINQCVVQVLADVLFALALHFAGTNVCDFI